MKFPLSHMMLLTVADSFDDMNLTFSIEEAARGK